MSVGTAVARAAPRTDQQRLTLLACILGSSAAFLDGTLVNVALPAIRADLHGGLAAQQWIVDAYLLTLGSLLLVGGSLGDVYGRRTVFANGVAAFGVASLLCAIAPSVDLLIVARALQGAAAALLVPSTLALIMDTFTDHGRAAAIGTWTAWTGISTVLGPLLGGLLIQAGSWRWIFVVNLPLVAATLWLIRRTPSSARQPGVHVDWTGAVLCVLGLAGPVFALIEQPLYGWGDIRVLTPLVAGFVVLAAFVALERRKHDPMLPLELFRIRNFSIGNVATFGFYAALSAFSFLLVVFLQQVAGYSALKAGLALMPLPILGFLLARRFGALADRLGPRLFMGAGPIVAGFGLLLLLRVGARPSYAADVLPGITAFALGLAITVAPLTAAVLSSVEAGHAGAASGANNAIARVAGLIAIAAVGAVVAARFSHSVDTHLGSRNAPARAVARAKERPLVLDVTRFPPEQHANARQVLVTASVDGYRVGIWISAGLAFAAGLVSLVGIQNPRRSVLAASCPGGAICGASTDLTPAGETVPAAA